MLDTTRRMMSNALAASIAIGGLAFAPAAFAGLFKCTVDGKVQYQQAPCVSGVEKTLDVNNRREREAPKQLIKQATRTVSSRYSGGTESGVERSARAEQAMRSYFEQTLIDPSSIQLRNIQVFLDIPSSKLRAKGSQTTLLVDVVCGEMNSKNRMGGYVGFRHFYWDSGEEKAVGPLDNRQFGSIMEELAQRTCSRLK